MQALVQPVCTSTDLQFASIEFLEQYFFDVLFGYFSEFPGPSVAFGVSGGADSLALAYLFTRWKLLYAPDIVLLPFIVDHGIRKESRKEAERVVKWLCGWGLESLIISCSGDIGNNQASWRKARYEALLLACHTYQVFSLALAHHQDDVLETVWMRQRASSDWRGCAGISSHRIQWNIHIFRPLLAWPKSCMYRILKHIQHPWIEDPSNQCQHFQRWKARCVIKSQSDQERQELWKSTLSFAKQRNQESLDWKQSVQVSFFAGGCKISRSSACFNLPVSQGARILSQWLFSIIPGRTPLSQSSLCKAWNRMLVVSRNASPCVVLTLGGCVIIHAMDAFYCFREWERIVPYKPLEHLVGPWIWDHRFLFFQNVDFPVCASAYDTPLYPELIADTFGFSKYVARWACACMPNVSGGFLCYPSVPCPVFSLPFGLSFL
ncbi:tRNA(Ile)-lysidine synthase [Holospora obtusa F1]|uniref:tRNA(Ile)-lysidine synthase n=1 Tax=Holospora obtusa F1 TaxID=1399147 RepID=W6TDE3_HOLOB|nr:tRNA lysidine(34) synthetase TilS [Holospora obtusa]ETZ06766.1 tRNA(Ile)-lysidine synthase [Holospora obtusa F1]